jgi:hypothetical protein
VLAPVSVRATWVRAPVSVRGLVPESALVLDWVPVSGLALAPPVVAQRRVPQAWGWAGAPPRV